jgi:hypothetical protein
MPRKNAQIGSKTDQPLVAQCIIWNLNSTYPQTGVTSETHRFPFDQSNKFLAQSHEVNHSAGIYSGFPFARSAELCL